MLYATRTKRKEVYPINTRIKKLRKALDITQQDFADKLGIKRNTVATYETGKSKPSDAAVNLICREFNVNEEWLRTGSGEMFRELSREDEIAAFFEDVLRDDSDGFRRQFVSMLARLDTSDWEELERLARKMVSADLMAHEPPPWGERPRWTAEQHAVWESEARAEAEEVYRQVLQEKKAAAESSASPPDLLA